MGENTKIANELFADGFSCSASVFGGFSENYGLDKTTAAKLACGLGGGCRAGEVCGAVSGAILVVGLKYGQSEPGGSAEQKAECSQRTVEFIKAFSDKFGALTCRDLIEIDVTTEEGRARLAEKRPICAGLVDTAAQILEDAGY